MESHATPRRATDSLRKGLRMSLATIISKGRITIPKEVRERLGLHTGDKIYFLVLSDGTVCMKPMTLRPSNVFGMLKNKSRVRATIPQMDASVAEAFRKRKA